MVTLKDISKVSKYSISTISKVVNGDIGDLKLETVQKIREILDDYKYSSNRNVGILRSKAANIIGLVIPMINQYFFAALTSGIEKYAELNNNKLIICNTKYDPDLENQFINDFINLNAFGIIISRVSDESRVVRSLHNIKLPVVIIDNVLINEMVPTVVVDNYLAGNLAALHLFELSHKKFACVSGPSNNNIARMGLAGFKDYLKDKNVNEDDIHVFYGNFDFESGVSAVKDILQKKLKVDAIWAQNDLIALGALKELKKNNIKVPEDISIVGMDDIYISTLFIPELTTIRIPIDEMCKRAVELIKIQSEGKNVFEKNVFTPTLVVRNSTMQR